MPPRASGTKRLAAEASTSLTEGERPQMGPSGRFSRDQRIRKRSEFQRIQAGSRRCTTNHFVLLVYARGDGSNGARLGLIVSRRVGVAVVRSRAKRLIREAFRATRALWAPDVDLVVIARAPIGTLGLSGVVAEWRAASGAIERRVAEARADRQKRESTLADPA